MAMIIVAFCVYKIYNRPSFTDPYTDFPPSQPRRLLSQEEYNQQRVDETLRSLANLRNYINNPINQPGTASGPRNPLEENANFLRALEDSMAGDNEFQRSLENLRNLINNPINYPVVSRLRNPERMSSFANGAPHLLDSEIEEYSRILEESMGNVPDNEAEAIMRNNIYYRPTGRRLGARPRRSF